MSRGVVYDPVCSGGATLVTRPPLIRATSVVYDPKCAILSGTQTAVTDLPSTG
jgi:hypothetical protein